MKNFDKKGKDFFNSHVSTIITENSPCGICVISTSKKIVDVNVIALKFYGLNSKSKILGTSILNFIDKSFRKQANIFFDQVVSSGKSKLSEIILVNTKGEKLWVECKLSLYKDKLSNEKFLIQYFRDLSEKKRMENFLVNEKNKYEQFYENLNIGLYRTTPAGELIYANTAFAKIFGFKKVDEIFSKSFSEILFVYKYPRMKFFKLLKREKSIVGFETSFTLPNGKTKYIRESAKLIYENKKIIGIEGSVEDVSDKVLMTKKLEESEVSYKGLFNSIKEAVYIQDKEGKFLDVNDGALKMYGYSKKDFIGNTPAFLSAPNKNDFLKLSSQIELAFKGIPQEFEFWGLRKNGEIFPKNVRLYKGKYFGIDVVIALAQDISEKKAIIEKLEASETQYKSLFESNPNPMWVYDVENLKFLAVNDAAIKHYGYSKKEFLKMTIKDIRPKEDIPALIGAVKNVSSGFSLPKVWRHIKKNKEMIFVEISSYTIEYFGRKAELILSYDVTERIKSTEEIIKLSQAVEQSSAMVLITDKQGNLEYVNKKFTEVSGYFFSEVIGRNPKFLNYKTEESENKNVWQTLEKGKSWKGEFTNKKKNGELFYVSALISPIRDKQKNIVSYLAIEDDITAFKLQGRKILKYQKLISGFGYAVQKLLTIDDFEQSLIQTLEILTKAVEADRGYIFENHIDSISGELLMNQIYECVVEGIEPQIGNPLLQKLSYKEVGFDANDFQIDTILNLQVNKLTGFLRNILESQNVKSLAAVPIFVNKVFWGYFGFDNCREEEILGEDEKQILKAAAINIGRAIERELIRNELVSAKNEAQKADKLKTEFLAQISHEIRSPLNIIMNYSSLLKEYFTEQSDPDIFEMFNGIDNAGSRIIRTIDLILNLAELQTNSYDFTPKKIDLFEDVLQLLILEYKNNAKRKNIELTFSLKTDDAKVFVDEYSVTQVFANLFDNAIKYTERGKISVNIVRDKNNKLNVEIEDTGIGISEKYLPNLFSPFRQEEQGYSRKYEGNGLGLSLVKKYCELNNADINVQSRKGHGTKFTVVFH